MPHGVGSSICGPGPAPIPFRMLCSGRDELSENLCGCLKVGGLITTPALQPFTTSFEEPSERHACDMSIRRMLRPAKTL